MKSDRMQTARMPDQNIVEEFIATVEANRHDEAIDRFYADHATMQENLDEVRRGKQTLLARERAFMAKLNKMKSCCVRPVFVTEDRVVIRWKFEFLLNDGAHLTRDEIAYQLWEDNKIVEERFYYDPHQPRF